jgi:hypothetical protein
VAKAMSEGVHRDLPGCPGLVLDLDELRDDIARLRHDEPDDPDRG